MRKRIEDFNIEEWCEKFKAACKNPMSDKQANLLFTVLLNREKIDEDEKFKEEIDKLPSYATVMMKRIEVGPFTYTLSNSALIFLDSLVDNFGTITMVCAYLQYVSHRIGKTELGIKEIGIDAFPFGFPSEEDLQKLWDEQKIDRTPDNALDYKGIYKPLKSL